MAEQLSTVPLLQGAQVAVAGADVDGRRSLDASFKFRFATAHQVAPEHDRSAGRLARAGRPALVACTDRQ